MPSPDTLSTIADAAPESKVGSFSINGGIYFGADSPFGGFKQSGIGREMGIAGLEEFLERKTFAVQPVPAVPANGGDA